MLVYYLDYSTLKMKMKYFSETMVHFQRTTWSHILEYRTFISVYVDLSISCGILIPLGSELYRITDIKYTCLIKAEK
jgi:hypothetical protein